MKKLFCTLAILSMFLAVSVYGDPQPTEKKDEEKQKPTFQKQEPCPRTTMINNCLECHEKGSFRIIKKEVDPYEKYKFPNMWKTKIVGDTLHYRLEEIDSSEVEKVFDYFAWHPELKRILIEVYSPGGSMMGAWRIIGIMDQAKEKGIQVDTLCQGYGASAGFMIFVNGMERMVSRTALLMWHEVMQIKQWDVATPATKEDESRILRLFQDNANAWLASESRMTKEDIDAAIRYKEFWMNGSEAIKYGFADKLIK